MGTLARMARSSAVAKPLPWWPVWWVGSEMFWAKPNPPTRPL